MGGAGTGSWKLKYTIRTPLLELAQMGVLEKRGASNRNFEAPPGKDLKNDNRLDEIVGLSFISSSASSICRKSLEAVGQGREVSSRPVSIRDASFSMRSLPPGIRPPRMVLCPMPQPHSTRGIRT